MGLNEFDPNFLVLSTENRENISLESARSSTHGNKNRSETKVSELLRESKADGNLQVVGSQLTSKSSKRKLGTKDQSNYDSSYKRKFPTEKDLKGTGDKELHQSHVGNMRAKKEICIKIIDSWLKMKPLQSVSPTYIICLTKIYALVIRRKTSLKQMQLMAYHTVLKALYLLKTKTIKWKDEILLTDLRDVLHISNAEHAKALNCIMSTHYNKECHKL